MCASSRFEHPLRAGVRATIRRALFALVLCLALAVPAISAQDADYEVVFSPRGNSLELVLKTISSARKSIRVAAYSFTSRPVAEALAEAYKRGVDVKLVADRAGNSDRNTVVAFLVGQGVPVRLYGDYASMHHKFMVIDGMHLQTGSYNYSVAAGNKNADNVLVLHDMPMMVEQYTAEWERIWDESLDVKAQY
ncbi:MAG: phospholipase D family protein [Deltaproteobacteria bacterium]|jgi:phosphatidylserine/phosphatidylglycerophosphate/cardiolipin synthase-like enzyme|nr:phospholipase D family protein [Deltaproteobacteria bacterium]